LYDIVCILINVIELRSFEEFIELYLEIITGIELELELFEDVLRIDEVNDDPDDSWNDDETLYLLFEILHFEEKGCRGDKGDDIVDEG
jgi:hypothetical protein